MQRLTLTLTLTLILTLTLSHLVFINPVLINKSCVLVLIACALVYTTAS